MAAILLPPTGQDMGIHHVGIGLRCVDRQEGRPQRGEEKKDTSVHILQMGDPA